MEAVLFDCHYKKKCSSYGYSGEGNARTLGESHSLEHTHPQQMPTIFGTDAPRPPDIPVISWLHRLWHFSSQTFHPSLPQPSRVEASSLFPILPCNPTSPKGWSRGVEESVAITGFRKRSLMRQWVSPGPCCIISPHPQCVGQTLEPVGRA